MGSELQQGEAGKLAEKALGAGSQMLQPLAIAVIGGVVISMVLSLIITPAVHFFVSRDIAETVTEPKPVAA